MEILRIFLVAQYVLFYNREVDPVAYIRKVPDLRGGTGTDFDKNHRGYCWAAENSQGVVLVLPKISGGTCGLKILRGVFTL